MPDSINGKLILLRHGETALNVEGRLSGQLEIPLNSLGIAQAREAGRILVDLSIDKVFSSTLTRAFNTAALALEASGRHGHLQIEQCSDIVEVDFGVFSGESKKNVDLRRFWGSQVYDNPHFGGESARDVFDRVDFFYKKQLLPRLQKGETVLVVAHSGIVRAFDVVLGFEPVLNDGDSVPMKKYVENAKPFVVEFEDGKVAKSYPLEPPALKNSQPKIS